MSSTTQRVPRAVAGCAVKCDVRIRVGAGAADVTCDGDDAVGHGCTGRGRAGSGKLAAYTAVILLRGKPPGVFVSPDVDQVVGSG